MEEAPSVEGGLPVVAESWSRLSRRRNPSGEFVAELQKGENPCLV